MGAGVMEELLKQIEKLNEKVDHLSATSQQNKTMLIDGKAALTAEEASQLSGICSQNLKSQADNGEWPFFKNGRKYMFPTGPFLKRLGEKGLENMKQKQKQKQLNLIKFSS